MAPRIIRPKLKLPATWVEVPDGVLLWPELPFSKEKPPVEGEPPRRIRRREREYKRLHGQPSAATPPDDPDPSHHAAASHQYRNLIPSLIHRLLRRSSIHHQTRL